MRRALALFAVACGYRAVYGEPAEVKLHVHLERAIIADAVAADEVASGAREALAREGALAGGEGYPRLVVEVLRADERSDAIGVVGGAPRAAAVRRAIVARAWVQVRPDGAMERDTGDVRAEDLAATTATATPIGSELGAEDDARAAARRLGRALALYALGHPIASGALGRTPDEAP